MYTEHVISFIDILGYSEFVLTHTSEEVEQCVQIVLDAFSATPGDEVIGRRTTYFSDTIVTTIPIVAQDGRAQLHGTLFHELTALALAQADFFDRLGLFVRGSITIGLLEHSESRLFGPAVIEAHRLEQQAIWPRIVVSRPLINRYFSSRDLMARHHLRHSVEYRYVKPLIYRASDRARFVDYIGTLPFNLDNVGYLEVFLTKHRDAILAGLLHSDPRVVAKYQALAVYHNASVRRIVNEHLRVSFLIEV